ncbi:head GIN domain-containing protein [Chitinophaga sp. YIM B06452]|uniref:head GIN domain-containing protein n=1 Tax=Chitinophaga sp. YIM B06452 TaxID=3082158 RepID=UPI0031FEC52A
MKKIATFLFAALIAASGALHAQEKISGNGKLKKETRPVKGAFSEISSSGKYKLLLKQGNTHSIEIEADENILPYLETEIEDNELKLQSKKGYNVSPSQPITVWITLASLKEMNVSGQAEITSEGAIKGSSLEANFSGKVDAKLNLDYDKLEVSMSGSGKMKLNGRANAAEVNISGSGELDAPEMQSQKMELAISGSGNASVNVSEKLEVAISGSGNVKYRGNPTSVEQAVSGKGKVSKEN